MRLNCLHAKYEVKRVYDKWPIKCIKAISHSFSHRFSGAHRIFLFVALAIMCEFCVQMRTTSTKKSHKQNERVSTKQTTNTEFHMCKKWQKCRDCFQLVMHCLTNIIVISIMIRRLAFRTYSVSLRRCMWWRFFLLVSKCHFYDRFKGNTSFDLFADKHGVLIKIFVQIKNTNYVIDTIKHFTWEPVMAGIWFRHSLIFNGFIGFNGTAAFCFFLISCSRSCSGACMKHNFGRFYGQTMGVFFLVLNMLLVHERNWN